MLIASSEHRLSSQHLAAVPTPNIAELVLSVFSVHNHGFDSGLNAFSQVKHPRVNLDLAAIDKQPASCYVKSDKY